jgi:hypothetical protein
MLRHLTSAAANLSNGKVMDIVDQLSSKRLCFTVTSGRSGTKLLAKLLRDSADICAEHEPAPRFNYVFRSVVDSPEAARWWLLTEKLPAIARILGTAHAYAELSHLTCKGFIEPLLDFGLRPAFLMVSRNPRSVASSLFRIGAIPERTASGRLVLLGPGESPFLPLPGWRQLSDYQLCYWYAREIECRQAHYRRVFSDRGLEWLDLRFDDITDWNGFAKVSEFVGWNAAPDRKAFDEILASDQNPRAGLLDGAAEREPPTNLDEQELQVELMITARERDAA